MMVLTGLLIKVLLYWEVIVLVFLGMVKCGLLLVEQQIKPLIPMMVLIGQQVELFLVQVLMVMRLLLMVLFGLLLTSISRQLRRRNFSRLFSKFLSLLAKVQKQVLLSCSNLTCKEQDFQDKNHRYPKHHILLQK